MAALGGGAVSYERGTPASLQVSFLNDLSKGGMKEENKKDGGNEGGGWFGGGKGWF